MDTFFGGTPIDVLLPIGYTFEIRVQEQFIDDRYFYLEDSILPRKYYVTVTIVEDTTTKEWGQQKIVDYIPQEEVEQP